MADSALKLDNKHYDWILSFLDIDLRAQGGTSGPVSDDGTTHASGTALASPGAPSPTPREKPAGPPVSASKLTALAKDPPSAHRAWNKLSSTDKSALVSKMAAQYGAKFASEFKIIAESGKPDFTLYYWESRLNMTPEKLKAGGWRFKEEEVTGNAAYDVEIWVHPSGKTGRRDISTYHAPPAQPPAQAEEPPDLCDEIKKKLNEITKRLDAAMAALEDIVAQLEALPPGGDHKQPDEDFKNDRASVKKIIDELSELEEDAKDVDESCADEVSDEWMNGMEAMTDLIQRRNSVK